MYNPKDVFTEDGLAQHKVHIFNLKEAIFWLRNNADDLHLDALDEKPLDVIYAMEKLLESKVLENGDEEMEEDDDDELPPVKDMTPRCPHGARLDDIGLGFGCQGCRPHAD